MEQAKGLFDGLENQILYMLAKDIDKMRPWLKDLYNNEKDGEQQKNILRVLKQAEALARKMQRENNVKKPVKEDNIGDNTFDI